MQTVLTAAGYVIGSYFGYPQLGAFIGAALGQAFFGPEDQHFSQQRPDDLKLTNVGVGAHIPFGYGVFRSGGSLIGVYNRDTIPVTTEVGGGKGAPTTTQTTYIQKADLVVLYHDGEIAGYGRCWRNNKIVYDPINSPLVGLEELKCDFIEEYLGTSSQLPSPTIEAVKGIGQTSAYRNSAYVVYGGADLTDTNGIVGNWEREVIVDGTLSTGLRVIFDNEFWDGSTADPYQPWSFGYHNGAAIAPFLNDLPFITGVEGGVVSVTRITSLEQFSLESPISGQPLFSGAVDTALFGPDGEYVGVGEVNLEGKYEFGELFSPTGSNYANFWDGSTPIARLFDGRTLYYNTTSLLAADGPPGVFVKSIFIGFSPNDPTDAQDADNFVVDIGSIAVRNPGVDEIVGVIPSNDGKHFIIVRARQSDLVRYYTLYEYDGSVVIPKGVHDLGGGLMATGFAPTNYGGSGHWVGGRTGVAASVMETNQQFLWVYGPRTGAPITLYEINSSGDIVQLATYSPGVSLGYPSIWADDRGNCWIAHGNHIIALSRIPSVIPSPVPLSEVISRLCLRKFVRGDTDIILNGYVLLPIDIDVSDPDLASVYVSGFKVTRRQSLTSTLQSLRQAYLFDCADVSKLQFALRTGNVEDTIDVSEMVTRQPGEPALVIRRNAAIEVPQHLDLVYDSLALDYQPGTQHAKRTYVPTREPQSIYVPVLLTDEEAAKKADILLSSATSSKTVVQFSTGAKKTHWIPGTVVTITDRRRNPELSLTVRITSRSDEGIKLNWEAEGESSSIYDSSAVGASIGYVSPSVSPHGPSFLSLLDPPLLRDVDDDPYQFAIISTALASWPGAQIYKSEDDASYTPIATATRQGKIGICSSILGVHYGNSFDEKNFLNVTYAGTLSNATRQQAMNGAQAALIGSLQNGFELVFWRDSTQLSSTQWKISGFMRGKAGTEDLISTHSGTELFIPLDPAYVLRLNASLADYAQTRYYKSVTFGKSLASAPAKSIASTMRHLVPLSPTAVALGVGVSDSKIAQWRRRARVAANWLVNDVALDEPIEQYRVRFIVDGATVHERVVTGATSTVYTAAEQTADTGDVIDLDDLSVEVRQISTRVGDGLPGYGYGLIADPPPPPFWLREFSDNSIDDIYWNTFNSGTVSASGGLLNVSRTGAYRLTAGFTDGPDMNNGAQKILVRLGTGGSLGISYRTYTYFESPWRGFHANLDLSGVALYDWGTIGVLNPLASAAIGGLTTGVTYEFMVEFRDDRHAIWLDGNLVLEFTDNRWMGLPENTHEPVVVVIGGANQIESISTFL